MYVSVHDISVKENKKIKGFPGGANGKESTCQCKKSKRLKFDPWFGEIPWSRKWQPTPVFLPGELHEQRNLEGYSPRGCKESDMTEQLSTKKLKTLPNFGKISCNLKSRVIKKSPGFSRHTLSIL